MPLDSPFPLLGCEDLQLRVGADSRAHLAAMIQAAERRVWVQQFIVAATTDSDPMAVVFDHLVELVRAADRGVDVRVLLDPFSAGSAPVAWGARTYLEARGVGVRMRYEAAHAKVVLADDRAWVSSANASAGGFVENLEAGIEVRSPALTTVMASQFLAGWEDAE